MSLYAIIAIAFLFLSLSASLYYNYKFGIIILNIEDSIEDSLDILDDRYRAISAISTKPVFFDSLEIRQVIEEIKKSRDAILAIANILTDQDGNTYLIEEVETINEVEINNDKKDKKNINATT